MCSYIKQNMREEYCYAVNLISSFALQQVFNYVIRLCHRLF